VAFRIANLSNGKGDFVGLLILTDQFLAGFLQILTDQVGGQGKQDADTKDTVGQLRGVQHKMEKDGHPGTRQKFD